MSVAPSPSPHQPAQGLAGREVSACEARDGRVYRHGRWVADPAALRRAFIEEGRRNAYWRAEALRHALEIRAAMRAARTH